MIQSTEQLAQTIGVVRACQVLAIPRSRLYRARMPVLAKGEPGLAATASGRGLSQSEKANVRQVLDSPRFQDQAPQEVYATLIDEGQYG